MTVALDWKKTRYGEEAILGGFEADNGVRFSIMHMPTCQRRGPWHLLVEVESHDHSWGCFDSQDQPERWYHSLDRLKAEAQAIADVLAAEHEVKVSL